MGKKVGFLVLLVLASAHGQAPKNIPAGKSFEQVQTQFESDVAALKQTTRGTQNFSPGDVNYSLQATKSRILAQVPTADAPLRDHVERTFPKPLDQDVPAEPAQVESAFVSVRKLLARLTKLPTFTVDITIRTTPSQATFELIPSLGRSISTTTDDRITNVFRGEYKYIITKAGYKTVNTDINFIERAGQLLDCKLQPESAAEKAQPCQFR